MITVFGSINLDLVVCLPRLPVPGETVVGPDHQTFAGGKGANQALAAARAGASVRMVGAVGRDAHSAPALANLDLAGVDLSAVRHLEGTTGLAMIGIDAEGENLIMCASGVNARVAADWLDGVLEPDDLLVLQRELSADPISGAIARARKVGARVLLNAAPSGDAALAGLIGDVDVLVANAVEAAELAGAFGCPGAEGGHLPPGKVQQQECRDQSDFVPAGVDEALPLACVELCCGKPRKDHGSDSKIPQHREGIGLDGREDDPVRSCRVHDH